MNPGDFKGKAETERRKLNGYLTSFREAKSGEKYKRAKDVT